jgi:hypothetical protein
LTFRDDEWDGSAAAGVPVSCSGRLACTFALHRVRGAAKPSSDDHGTEPERLAVVVAVSAAAEPLVASSSDPVDAESVSDELKCPQRLIAVGLAGSGQRASGSFDNR